MTNHIGDELPRLLRGDATQDEVATAAAHLRECTDCRQELVDAVASHAALTSASRFAPEAVATSAAPAQPARAATPLPDLSAVFAQVRAEADAEPRPARPITRRPMMLAAAAVVGLAVGGGAVAAIEAGNSGSSSGGQTVALTAYDVGHTSATATISTAGQMKLNAASLPKLAAAKRYEVWLTNAGRTRMQPIGWVGTDGKAVLTVPVSLMSRYTDIEVSVQPLNASGYTYSGTSVLRGSYA